MSVRVSHAVWEYSRHEGGALLVLLALANFADDQGRRCYPSVATLARMARLTERQVWNILPKLVASGELQIESKSSGRHPTHS